MGPRARRLASFVSQPGGRKSWQLLSLGALPVYYLSCAIRTEAGNKSYLRNKSGANNWLKIYTWNVKDIRISKVYLTVIQRTLTAMKLCVGYQESIKNISFVYMDRYVSVKIVKYSKITEDSDLSRTAFFAGECVSRLCHLARGQSRQSKATAISL